MPVGNDRFGNDDPEALTYKDPGNPQIQAPDVAEALAVAQPNPRTDNELTATRGDWREFREKGFGGYNRADRALWKRRIALNKGVIAAGIAGVAVAAVAAVAISSGGGSVRPAAGPAPTTTPVATSVPAAAAAPTQTQSAVYVFTLDNVASPGNIWIGPVSDFTSKPYTCDWTDGGLCPPNTPVKYTKRLGPFTSYDAATAAFCQAAVNPHPAFGGEKVYIFGSSYFIDNLSVGCPVTPTS